MSQTEAELGREQDQNRAHYAEPPDLDDDEPRSIERRIDATRADMRATLGALERRFSMDRLVELTIGRVRERGGEFAGNLTEAAAQNPVPLLLTSIGVGWMMLANRRGWRTALASAAGMADNASGIRQTLRGASERAHAGMEEASERMRGAAESVRESFDRSTASVAGGATRAWDKTRDGMAHARERMDSLLEEQPLILGAIGLAAGAILGAWLPTTEQEDRWLGDLRERAVKGAVETGRRRYEAVTERVAEPQGERFDEPARDEAAAQRPH